MCFSNKILFLDQKLKKKKNDVKHKVKFKFVSIASRTRIYIFVGWLLRIPLFHHVNLFVRKTNDVAVIFESDANSLKTVVFELFWIDAVTR